MKHLDLVLVPLLRNTVCISVAKAEEVKIGKLALTANENESPLGILTWTLTLVPSVSLYHRRETIFTV